MIEAVLAHYGLELNRDHGEFAVNAFCHEDRHKSASVNMDKGLYSCFTCSWGGDGYTIIQRMEGITFGEAVKFAEKLGANVTPNTKEDRQWGKPRGKRKTYIPSWKR